MESNLRRQVKGGQLISLFGCQVVNIELGCSDSSQEEFLGTGEAEGDSSGGQDCIGVTQGESSERLLDTR